MNDNTDPTNPLDPANTTISLEELEKLEELVGAVDDGVANTVATDDGGESAVSGDAPDVESDDNVLDNMHDVGLHLNESDDGEEVEPLNIAKDVEEAEKFHKDH